MENLNEFQFEFQILEFNLRLPIEYFHSAIQMNFMGWVELKNQI